MAHSLSILKLTDTTAELNLPAINSVLDQVGNRPFAIYSINGNFRTGKSLMLNFFLQYLFGQGYDDWFKPEDIDQKRFHWRGGSKPDTDGIYIWSEPLEVDVGGGKKVCVLLMDTQGSFDAKSSMQQNAVVFAISALFSSVLIMNVSKQISDDTLQFFKFFTGFAELAMENQNLSDDLRQTDLFFQKLIFLIRDFQCRREYPLVYYDDTVPDPNYKKVMLNPATNNPDENNYVREYMAEAFDNVAVGLLPYPGEDLAEEDIVNNLSKNFNTCTKQFIERIFRPEYIATKKIRGQEVTGTQFKKFVQGWAELFRRTDSLPTVQSISETTAKVQNILAMKDALACYSLEMKKHLQNNSDGLTSQEFDRIHQESKAKSSNIFKSVKKLGGKKYDETYSEELASEIQFLKENFQNINTTNLNATKLRQKLEEEQRILNAKMQATQQQFETFQTESKVEKDKLASELNEMQRREQQMAKEMQRSAEAHDQLFDEHRRLKTRMADTEERLEKAKSGGGELQQMVQMMQQQNQNLMEKMERDAAAHRTELINIHSQIQQAQKPRKRKWYEAPLNVLTMGLSGSVTQALGGLFGKK